MTLVRGGRRSQTWDRVHVSRGMLLPLLPGTPQNCLRRFCGEPHSGFPPTLGKSSILYHGSVDYPLPAGFPRNRSPLKGNPPFRGTPSALGHEGVRGRRLHGAAMLCRLQCARFANRVAHCRRTSRQPSALIRSPPTFKRRQAACESLAGRLHFERDNIVSGDVTLGFFVKLSNVHLFGASPSTMKPFSKTESRAAQPNLHSGHLRPLLQVAARPATSQARRNIK